MHAEINSFVIRLLHVDVSRVSCFLPEFSHLVRVETVNVPCKQQTNLSTGINSDMLRQNDEEQHQ